MDWLPSKDDVETPVTKPARRGGTASELRQAKDTGKPINKPDETSRPSLSVSLHDMMNGVVAFNEGATFGLSTLVAAKARQLSSDKPMTWDEALTAERDENAARRAESPTASLVGGIAGAILGPGKAIAAIKVAGTLGRLARIGASAAGGATAAATSGGDVTEGALYGAAGGTLGELGSTAAGVVRKLGNKQVKKVMGRATESVVNARAKTRAEITKQLGIDASKLDDLYVDKLGAVIKNNPTAWTHDVPEKELAKLYLGQKVPAPGIVGVRPEDYGSQAEYLAALKSAKMPPGVSTRLGPAARGAVAGSDQPQSVGEALKEAVREAPANFVKGTIRSGGNVAVGAAAAKAGVATRLTRNAKDWVGSAALRAPESALRLGERGSQYTGTTLGQMGAQQTEPVRTRLGAISNRIRLGEQGKQPWLPSADDVEQVKQPWLPSADDVE